MLILAPAVLRLEKMRVEADRETTGLQSKCDGMTWLSRLDRESGSVRDKRCNAGAAISVEADILRGTDCSSEFLHITRRSCSSAVARTDLSAENPCKLPASLRGAASSASTQPHGARKCSAISAGKRPDDSNRRPTFRYSRQFERRVLRIR